MGSHSPDIGPSNPMQQEPGPWQNPAYGSPRGFQVSYPYSFMNIFQDQDVYIPHFEQPGLYSAGGSEFRQSTWPQPTYVPPETSDEFGFPMFSPQEASSQAMVIQMFRPAFLLIGLFHLNMIPD